MTWQIEFDPSALKELNKLDKPVAVKISLLLTVIYCIKRADFLDQLFFIVLKYFI
jgi:mRNA-degrading endonuclease RelE of RelBE toxin-antitoxin system